ncbi:MAG: hypothetical protein Q8S12_10280 [Hydrogenophaga sp.]|nr:hypothetical protein [Hydrogenophaga sp.]
MFLPSFARADASQCSDALVQGTKAESAYRESYAFRQLVDLRFSQVGYERSKSDRSLTGTIPIGNLVIGGSYDEAQYRARSEAIRRSQNWDTSFNRDVDIILSTGDPEILKAWSACMTNKRGGLSVRFDEVKAKSAVVRVEWFGASGVNQVILSSPGKLPDGVSIVQGGDCLAPGKVIVANTQGCSAVLSFTSAETPVQLALNTDKGEGSAQAYLPARRQLVKKSRPFQGAPGQETSLFSMRTEPRSSNLKERLFYSDYENGWFFDPASFQWAVTTIERNYPPGNHTSSGTIEVAGGTSLKVRHVCTSATKHWIRCHGTFSILEDHYSWEPAKD